jgi:hypothetical protein
MIMVMNEEGLRRNLFSNKQMLQLQKNREANKSIRLTDLKKVINE